MQRISVVIPSYNHEAFIADAIRSVAAQDIADLELVIIDDGSSDRSVERIHAELEGVALERVVFREQENRGAHDAIMRGISESTGGIIAILNSDDRFAPDRFKRMTPYFEARDDFLAFSMLRVIGASGAVLPDSHPTPSGYRHALYEATRCPTVGFGLLRNNFSVTSGNFVFTRSLYDRIGGFSEHQLAHDWDFLLRALVHVEPIFVPERLMDYRFHETNTIHEVGVLAEEEGSEILNGFLSLCSNGTANPLAPCPQNWPLYFDLFVSRYAPWFGGPSIRAWLDDAVEVEGSSPGRSDWSSWAEAVDFEPVDDCGYIVEPGPGPATLDTLALARDVLLSESHPLAHEAGEPNDALRELFGRRAHPLARIQCPPWRSPLAGAVVPHDAPLESRPSVGPAPSTVRQLLRRVKGLQPVVSKLLKVRHEANVARRIRQSGLFDADYYLAMSGLTGLRRSRALDHYLSIGWRQGLDPHPLFDTSYYLESNPDVARSDLDPLMHYLAHGAVEGRNPHPLFSSRFYLDSNPDVAATDVSPLAHYARFGAFEGRAPHPRFDAEFYREHCSEPIPEGVSPLAHYVLVGADKKVPISHADELSSRLESSGVAAAMRQRTRERGPLDRALRQLRFSGLFEPDYYSQHIYSHSEISDSFRHFVEIGSLEGLPFCHPERLVEQLERLRDPLTVRPELEYLRKGPASGAARDTSVDLFVSSLGNPVYREMAEILAETLRRGGFVVRVLNETEYSDRGDTQSLIFAPHEFFPLGKGLDRLDAEWLSRSHLFMAESPGSPYFSIGLWFAQHARGVLDANPESAYVWGKMGFRSHFVPLGRDEGGLLAAPGCRDAILRGALPNEDWESPPPLDSPLEERPLDILFDGESSPRRCAFFAREAALFASMRCALFMPVPNLKPSSGPESALNRSEAASLARHAKIVLALQRDVVPHFDWYRGVSRGMGHGALLVAEEGLQVPELLSGEHYIECPASKIPAVLHWLVETPDGRAEAETVRRRGMETLEQVASSGDVLRRLFGDMGASQERDPATLEQVIR